MLTIIILGGYTVKVNTVHVANSECHWNFLVMVTKMYSDVHHKPQYNNIIIIIFAVYFKLWSLVP